VRTALVLLQLFNFKLDKTLFSGFYILFGTGIGELIDQIKLHQKVKQDYIQLNTGDKMPLLGLGVYNMHGVEAENAVARALQMGYRLIDTATSYKNEQEVGLAIRNSGIAPQ
jgi:hypothetical protein